MLWTSESSRGSRACRSRSPALVPSVTMSTSKLNVDGIMLFEQPFARVPYENYRKVFRSNQRLIERELGVVQNMANDLNKRAKTGALSSQDTVKSIDSMISRTENLKRKVCFHVHSSKSLTKVESYRCQIYRTRLENPRRMLCVNDWSTSPLSKQ